MKTPSDASALANALVGGARAAGRKAAALVTRMDAPLGFAVGNANEVREAIRVLSCESGAMQDGEVALCVELAAMMVSLAKELPLDEARGLCRDRLADGSAKAKFEAMVEAHGGDLGAFEALLRRPTFKFRIQAMKSGFVSDIDAERVGRVALALGAGREKPGDSIDPLAGVTLAVKVGDRVATGAPLATLEKSSGPDGLEAAAAELYKAFRILQESPQPEQLIVERVGQ